jgi:hypothetical protein
MIKQLKKSDVTMSPFNAAKAWEMFNIENDNTVLIEQNNDLVAMDYNDYTTGNPILNRDCNIALEEQDNDLSIYEEGISGSIKFDPYTDPKNDDGTYKTLVYNQINKAFYNNYKNPTEIFGMENIDFPLSKTNRYLADNFRMFTIPQQMFGDKLVPGSVQLYDTAFDDNVVVLDDKVGNLVAGENLFSKIQEVRPLGNTLLQGNVINGCSGYIPPTVLAFSSDGGFESGPYISWENHTASMLVLNSIARNYFEATRFLTSGDNACQGAGVYNGYQGQCGDLIGPSQSIWAAMGNHDRSDMGGISGFKTYFGYTNEYYTWTEGNVQGFVLYETDATGGHELAVGSPQYLWLSQSLSSSMEDPTISWRIVQVHAPALCSPSSHVQNTDLNNIPWENWGVNAVFSGHNHVVERLESGSVAFFVCAGISNQKTGYPINTPSPYQKWWFTDATTGVYNYNSGYVYILIEASLTNLSISFYSGSNKLSDIGTTNIPNAIMSGYSLVLTK